MPFIEFMFLDTPSEQQNSEDHSEDYMSDEKYQYHHKNPLNFYRHYNKDHNIPFDDITTSKYSDTENIFSEETSEEIFDEKQSHENIKPSESISWESEEQIPDISTESIDCHNQ